MTSPEPLTLTNEELLQGRVIVQNMQIDVLTTELASQVALSNKLRGMLEAHTDSAPAPAED